MSSVNAFSRLNPKFLVAPSALMLCLGLSFTGCQSHQEVHVGTDSNKATYKKGSSEHHQNTITAKKEVIIDKEIETSSYEDNQPTASNIDFDKQCYDYLGKELLRTDDMHYLGCFTGHYGNQTAHIAKYEVFSSDVYKVQHHLQKISNMPALHKDCCQWESFNPSNNNNAGVLKTANKKYYINMQSSELKLGWNIASDIANIHTFDVYVISPVQAHSVRIH